MGFFSRRSGPPTEPSELVRWMSDQFQRERYAEVWKARDELGVGLTQGDMSQRDWFWINAFPALAALRGSIMWDNPFTGSPEPPPPVSTCAAWADENWRGLGEAEAEANAEIHRRFFA